MVFALLCSLGVPKRQNPKGSISCIRPSVCASRVQILGPIFDPDNCVLYVCLNNGMKAVQFCCILHHFPRKSPQILAPAAGSYFFQYRQKVLSLFGASVLGSCGCARGLMHAHMVWHRGYRGRDGCMAVGAAVRFGHTGCYNLQTGRLM